MPPARKGKGGKGKGAEKEKKKGPSERLAEAVEKQSVNHPLSNPITSFRIPVVAAALPDEEWVAYQVKYGMPVIKLHRYHDGEEHEACQVPVYIGGEPTAYLPLPLRCRDRWVLLCYRIVYWSKIRDFWGMELQRNGLSDRRRRVAQLLKNNCAVRLLSHVIARRLVAEELLRLGWLLEWGKESIYTLNEYLVRDSRDLLFTKFQDVGVENAKYLKSDPCDPRNDGLFQTNYMRGYASGEYMAPPPGDDSWIAGDIKGLEDIFKSHIRTQSYDFYLTPPPLARQYTELPYNANAKVPARWSETHEPALQYLSEERYLTLFMDGVRSEHRAAQNLSGSGVGPLERTPFDSPEVKGLLQAFHGGDADVPPTLERLIELIGAPYAPIISNLLDKIGKDPEGEFLTPYADAVEAARQSYLAEVKNAQAGPSGSNMDIDHSSHAQGALPVHATEEAYEAKIAEAFSGCEDLNVIHERLLGMFSNPLHPAINDWVAKHRPLEEARAAQADLAVVLRHEDVMRNAALDYLRR